MGARAKETPRVCQSKVQTTHPPSTHYQLENSTRKGGGGDINKTNIRWVSSGLQIPFVKIDNYRENAYSNTALPSPSQRYRPLLRKVDCTDKASYVLARATL